MKFSMDGFRKQLSRDIEGLKELIADVVNDEYVDKEDLVESMNEVIAKSNVLNCVFVDTDDLFNDLSNIEVEPLEI